MPSRARRFEIKLIGPFRVLAADGSPADLRSKGARAILLALALEPKGIERSVLTGLLWPETDAERAGASMRQAVRALRVALGGDVDPLVSTNDRIELNRALIDVDTDILAADLRAEHASGGTWVGRVGPLLDGWTGPSAEFEQRVSTACSAIEKTWRNSLIAIAEARLRGGHAELAVDAANAVLRLDPADEAAVAIAMDGYLALGARGIAADIYRAYQEEMRTTHMAPPSPMLAARLTSPPQETRPFQFPRIRMDQRTPVRVQAFRAMGIAPELAYLGDALSEEVASRLACNPRLRLIEAPGEEGEGLMQVGGALRVARGRCRVRVSLTKAPAGEVVWTDVLDEAMADVDGFLDTMSATLSARLQTALQVQADLRAAGDAQASPGDLIGRARQLFWRTGQTNNSEARKLLRQSLDGEPENLTALNTLTFVLLLDVWSLWSTDPEGDLREALTIAREAVRIAPRDPWCLFSLGTALGAGGRLDEAIEAQRRAIAFNPDFAPAIGELGRMLIYAGELDEGEAQSNAAHDLSPGDPHLSLWLNALSLSAFLKEDFEQALTLANKATAANGHWYQNHLMRAACLSGLDRTGEAREALGAAERMIPGLALAALKPGHPFAKPDMQARFEAALLKIGCKAGG